MIDPMPKVPSLEMRIIALRLEGQTYAEIGDSLGLTSKQVVHRKNKFVQRVLGALAHREKNSMEKVA